MEFRSESQGQMATQLTGDYHPSSTWNRIVPTATMTGVSSVAPLMTSNLTPSGSAPLV